MDCSSEEKPTETHDSSCQNQQLPVDIIVVILSRLPVKSLLRFRSACRSWCNLIFSPYFINLHRIHYNEDRQFVLLKGEGKLVLKDYASHSNPFVYLDPPADVTFRDSDDVGQLCSCNGLICFMDASDKMWLWNPSTGQHKKLPACNNVKDPMPRSQLGFGYDPVSDDYLIFRVFDSKERFSEVEIYSLNENTWTTMENIPYNIHYYTHRWTNPSCTPPVFGGALHWVGFRSDDESLHGRIVAFDLGSRKFREVPMPKDNFLETCDFQIYLLSGRIYLLCRDANRRQIWMMEEYGVRESWIKVTSFENKETITTTTEGNSRSSKFIVVNPNVYNWGLCIWVYDFENQSDGHTWSGMSFVESLVPVRIDDTGWQVIRLV